MNKLITIMALFLSLGIATDNLSTVTTTGVTKTEITSIENTSFKNETLTLIDELYDLKIHVETTDINSHNLVISMVLKNDSYYVSPNAKRAFTGKFTLTFGTDDKLSFGGSIIETPRSVEEIDLHPFVSGTINWVRINTIYKQPLKLKSNDNFELFGRLRFTIEPRCTLEEIPFTISYQNGVMKLIPSNC